MKATQLVKYLIAAKALIDTPEKWTQEEMARDAYGKITDYEGESATCFCSLGAACKVTAGSGFTYGYLVRALSAAGDGTYIVDFNDSHTHAEVMAVWDKAIDKAKAQAVVENLEAAKAKIASPLNWMQGYYARDTEGNEIRGSEPGAICFCSYGAVEAATGKMHRHDFLSEFGFLSEAAQILSGDSWNNAGAYNDEHTHAEVLVMFDKAIELAKEAAK